MLPEAGKESAGSSPSLAAAAGPGPRRTRCRRESWVLIRAGPRWGARNCTTLSAPRTWSRVSHLTLSSSNSLWILLSTQTHEFPSRRSLPAPIHPKCLASGFGYDSWLVGSDTQVALIKRKQPAWREPSFRLDSVEQKGLPSWAAWVCGGCQSLEPL